MVGTDEEYRQSVMRDIKGDLMQMANDPHIDCMSGSHCPHCTCLDVDCCGPHPEDCDCDDCERWREELQEEQDWEAERTCGCGKFFDDPDSLERHRQQTKHGVPVAPPSEDLDNWIGGDI